MADQLQLRRDSATNVAAFTGAQGEAIFDTTNNRLVMQDGTTPGGHPLAKLSEVLTNTTIGISGNYTAQVTDRAILITGITSPITINLPSAVAFPTGTPLKIMDASGLVSATLSVTTTPVSPQTEDNVSSYALYLPYTILWLESTGTEWIITNIFFPLQNGFRGNRLATLPITGTATITNANYGNSIEFQGTAPFTVNLAAPGSTLYSTLITPTLDFFNASTATITLTTASGNFIGPLGNNTTTITMATNTTRYLEWDGSNWVCKR